MFPDYLGNSYRSHFGIEEVERKGGQKCPKARVCLYRQKHVEGQMSSFRNEPILQRWKK